VQRVFLTEKQKKPVIDSATKRLNEAKALLAKADSIVKKYERLVSLKEKTDNEKEDVYKRVAKLKRLGGIFDIVRAKLMKQCDQLEAHFVQMGK